MWLMLQSAVDSPTTEENVDLALSCPIVDLLNLIVSCHLIDFLQSYSLHFLQIMID